MIWGRLRNALTGLRFLRLSKLEAVLASFVCHWVHLVQVRRGEGPHRGASRLHDGMLSFATDAAKPFDLR